MAEYWKSTPSYWCKFCSQYVRDTNIERKNHEATAKHQNNIQRSLRQLHKSQEQERREKQRAKDEVARLNGLFDGKPKSSAASPSPASTTRTTSTAATKLTSAAQRKAHAEQLAALGVELPEELKKEVTGVGSYQVVNQREVEHAQSGSVSVNRSLAEILAESKSEAAKKEAQESKEGIKSEANAESTAKGVHKRQADDDEDLRDEEAAPKRRAWGSNLKRYPGARDEEEDVGDLDALLSGVKKQEPVAKNETTDDGREVKDEDGDEKATQPLDSVPDLQGAMEPVAQPGQSTDGPAVVFKKRKGKK